MPESIFSKTYSYREKENKGSKENHLIEIFAHCLNSDRKFLNDFLNEVGLIADSETKINTQLSYKHGRPDIEINIPFCKTCILIECKIEHFERPNQLEDYKRILEEKNAVNRYLIYLTKYHDFRLNNNKKIKFHQLKWKDIFDIIDDKNSVLTRELQSYIKDENMSESKNFNYTDLSVLSNVTSTIIKMDEVLDGIKEYYERRIGILSKESARSTRIKDRWYATTHRVGGQNNYKYQIDIGFNWWDENEVSLFMRVLIPKGVKYKKTEHYYQIFKNLKKKDWREEVYDDRYVIIYDPSIAQFIIEEDQQTSAMVGILIVCVDELAALKKLDPRLFK